MTAIITAGFSAHLASLAGALFAVQGLIHDQLPGKRQTTGQILLIGGLGLGATGAYLWLGPLGLAIGLGTLSIVFLILGGRYESRTLDLASLISVACQAVVMGASHPALQQMSSFSWHIWSLGSLAIAVQLGWFWWSWRKGRAAVLRPTWVFEGLYMIQAIYVLAALSTELSLLISWIPAMTLLWTASAATLWVLGRHSQGLRAAAVITIGAAFVKLMAFDWALLGGGTRVALLMIVGTTMLVTPLFSPDGTADHGRQVSC